jgi:hypothetical protein
MMTQAALERPEVKIAPRESTTSVMLFAATIIGPRCPMITLLNVPTSPHCMSPTIMGEPYRKKSA